MRAGAIPRLGLGGDGPVVAFLHANGYPPACYRPFLELLARDYRVEAMEQRPLWPGERPEAISSWLPLTDDFMRFLDELEEGPILGIGHSLGAIVLLRGAMRRPTRFRAIILIDPVLFVPIIILAWRLVGGMGLVRWVPARIPATERRRREFDSLEVMFWAYRNRTVFRHLEDAHLHALILGLTTAYNGGYRLRYSPEWEARIYRTGIWPDLDLWRGLENLAVPCAVIRGAESDTFLPGAAAKLSRRAPAVRIKVIQRASHLVALERPGEVASYIHRFASELQT